MICKTLPVLSSGLRIVLEFITLAVASPAWSLGHWGYCSGTVEEPRKCVEYYSAVMAIHRNDTENAERKLKEFLKQDYLEVSGSFVPSTVCFIDCETRGEAEAYRTEKIAEEHGAVSVTWYLE